MHQDHYLSHYSLGNTMHDVEIPKLTGKEIVKAEQTAPESRAAKRQRERDEKRKHKIRYRRDV